MIGSAAGVISTKNMSAVFSGGGEGPRLRGDRERRRSEGLSFLDFDLLLSVRRLVRRESSSSNSVLDELPPSPREGSSSTSPGSID